MNTLTLASLVNMVVSSINSIVLVLSGVALALFFWAGIRYIYSAGDAKAKGYSKDTLVWGLVAMFVLVSIWGILRILQEALLP